MDQADHQAWRQFHLQSGLIADSALEDRQMQVSPTAAHISHSGVQPTAPQVTRTVG